MAVGFCSVRNSLLVNSLIDKSRNLSDIKSIVPFLVKDYHLNLFIIRQIFTRAFFFIVFDFLLSTFSILSFFLLSVFCFPFSFLYCFSFFSLYFQSGIKLFFHNCHMCFTNNLATDNCFQNFFTKNDHEIKLVVLNTRNMHLQSRQRLIITE